MNKIKTGTTNEYRIYITHFLKLTKKYLLSFITGFFFACASFMGLSPFGTSAVAGAKTEYLPVTVLGAAIGSFFLYGNDVLTMRYFIAGIISGIIAYLLKRNIKAPFHTYISAFSAFCALFSTGLVLSVSITISSEEFLLYAAEGIAGATGAVFINKITGMNISKRHISGFTPTETAAAITVFGIFILSLCSFDFLIFSPCVIFSVYSVLTCAFYGADRYGAIAGIVAGCVLAFYGKSDFLATALALGGLIGGFFNSFNKFILTLVFFISTFLVSAASRDTQQATDIIINISLAGSLFLFTPSKISGVIKNFFAYPAEFARADGQRGVLRSRLKTAADGMKDVTASVKAVAGIYRRRAAPCEESIYENTIKHICTDCENYNFCCNKNYNETQGWFKKIAYRLRLSDEPTEKELPQRFYSTCIKPGRIIKELAYESECYRTAMREAAKTGETVNIVSDQFDSVAGLLEKFSDEMENNDEYDISRTAVVTEYLTRELGLEVISCGVFTNITKHIYCELRIKDKPDADYGNAVRKISGILSISFEKPVVTPLSDGTVNVIFCEKTKYSVSCSFFQISSAGNQWCGDTYDSFFDGKGNFFVILSDGMGTGKRAAADSVMCCSLASELLRAGYPVECILRMINSAMLVRSAEESLATLDIALINLYTGEISFFKAGAASSVAVRKGKMLRIEKPSLPVGILNDVRFEEIELQLRNGDVFILMSDGVPDEALAPWREILRDASIDEDERLAARLADAALLCNENEEADDITVAAVVLL